MPWDFNDDNSTSVVQLRTWRRQQQAITWGNADPDLCQYMVVLGHNQIKFIRGLEIMFLSLTELLNEDDDGDNY